MYILFIYLVHKFNIYILTLDFVYHIIYTYLDYSLQYQLITIRI